MESNDPTRTARLFCWILHVSERSFSITIDDSQTVDDLKKAILKEKPKAFANVDPDELTLWKVRGFLFRQVKKLNTLQPKESITTDKNLKNNVANLELPDDEALLEADKLSDIFPHPEPTTKSLHIIVRSPSIATVGEH